MKDLETGENQLDSPPVSLDADFLLPLCKNP